MEHRDDFCSRPSTPIDETETDLCRAIWIAVAMQSIIDASSRSRKKAAIKAREEATQWLMDNDDEGSDFAMVCDLAGIDPGMLRKSFLRVQHIPSESIDFRCLKKCGINNRGIESRKRYFARVRKNDRLKREKNNEPVSSDSVRANGYKVPG